MRRFLCWLGWHSYDRRGVGKRLHARKLTCKFPAVPVTCRSCDRSFWVED